MRQSLKLVGAVALAALVAGCTSGNSGIEPGFTSTNLNNDKVQLAVGVASYYSVDSTGLVATPVTGLNVVATFRQPNGLSATLVNTPTITGPFVNPSTSGQDAGIGQISGTPQTLPGHTPAVSTLGQSGGVFAYGLAPDNATTSGAPQYNEYANPFFDVFATTQLAAVGPTQVQFIGGPPAYPTTRTPNYDPQFAGYTQGWTVFAIAPVAGSYNLTETIASGNHPTVTLTAPTATMASTTGLGFFAAPPAFTEDGTGGGTATCTAPAGVTETIVELQDLTTSNYYTFQTTGGGAVSAAFADNLGPTPAGAGATPGSTLNAGDLYTVQCIGADYPAFEAGPPQNTSITPTIVGSNGQADLTFSVVYVPATGGYAATAGKLRHLPLYKARGLHRLH